MDTSDETHVDQMEEDSSPQQRKVYLPGNSLNEDEELVCDESAYLMYHQAQTGAPCLSFDVIPDGLGNDRTEFPLTAYMVAGTQAERSHVNNLLVLKLSNLHRTKAEKDSDSEESSDEDEEEDPKLTCAQIRHSGCVNRIRVTQIDNTVLAASWSEQKKVHIWNLNDPLAALNDSKLMDDYIYNEMSPSPLFTFAGHQMEGFAMDWCTTQKGCLLTGDCLKNIHLWKPTEGSSWHVDQRPFVGHTASVEDIQWSPNEANVFASCSVDKSIRIWDSRVAPNKSCMLTVSEAHESDVNVINWNSLEPFIVSGGDDGVISVWDLRVFHLGKSVARFKHHTAPITSVEWNKQDGSVFAASASDDQLTIWDLAMERDNDDEIRENPELSSLPPQLLFIHQGQKDIKELHWHSQLPGVIIATAQSGFNVFRTISV